MKKLLIIIVLLLQSIILFGQTEFTSPNGKKKVVIRQTANKAYQVIVNSKTHKSYIRIVNNQIYFFSDSTRVAYIAQCLDGYCVVVDGIEQPHYQRIYKDKITFCPKNNHWAYAGLKDNKWYYIIDGKKRSGHGGFEKDQEYLRHAGIMKEIIFSPDGKHWAFIAVDIIKINNSEELFWYYIMDGMLQSYTPYLLLDPVFSPDSKHWAYAAKHEYKEYITKDKSITHRQIFYVIDGIKQPSVTDVSRKNIIFSPDSKHWAYAALYTFIIGPDSTAGLRWICVIDGEVYSDYYKVHEKVVVFSPDSKHWAFGAMKNDKWFYVIDGVEQPHYKDVRKYGVIFSPDSKHWAYGAKNKKWLYVVDDLEESHFDALGVKPFIFSEDSRHYAYRGQKDGDWCYVIDGVEQTHYDMAYKNSITFSPDFDHWAYVAIDRKKWFWIIDGTEESHYDRLDKRGLLFCPDSKNWAYKANIKRDWFCVEKSMNASLESPDLCSQLDKNGTVKPASYTIMSGHLGFAIKDISGSIEPEGLHGNFNGKLTINNIRTYNIYLGIVNIFPSNFQRQAFELGLAYGKPNTTINDFTESNGFYLSIYLNSKRYFFSYSSLQPYLLLSVGYTGLYIDHDAITYTGYDGERYDFAANNGYSVLGLALGFGLSYNITPYTSLRSSISHDILLGGSPNDWMGGGSLGGKIDLRSINFELGVEWDTGFLENY